MRNMRLHTEHCTCGYEAFKQAEYSKKIVLPSFLSGGRRSQHLGWQQQGERSRALIVQVQLQVTHGDMGVVLLLFTCTLGGRVITVLSSLGKPC